MFVEAIETELGKEPRISLINPIALAFVGDSVFDLFLRTGIVLGEDVSPKMMHLHASHFAKAETQCRMVRGIWERLSEEERDTVRRGRNAKVNTIPKHAQIVEYKMATGFEALLGSLYLQKQQERLWEILSMAMEVAGEDETWKNR